MEAPQDSKTQRSSIPTEENPSETGLLMSRLIICPRCGGPDVIYINHHSCEKFGRSVKGPYDQQPQPGRQLVHQCQHQQEDLLARAIREAGLTADDFPEVLCQVIGKI